MARINISQEKGFEFDFTEDEFWGLLLSFIVMTAGLCAVILAFKL